MNHGDSTHSVGTIEAWTDQHPAVRNLLQSAGCYHADGRRVPKSLRPAFRWLRNEMRSRVPGATGRPLVWLTAVPMVTGDDVCVVVDALRQSLRESAHHPREGLASTLGAGEPRADFGLRPMESIRGSVPVRTGE